MISQGMSYKEGDTVEYWWESKIEKGKITFKYPHTGSYDIVTDGIVRYVCRQHIVPIACEQLPQHIEPRMNKNAVELLNMFETYNQGEPMGATEEMKQQFTESLRDIHNHGYYVVYIKSTGEWVVRNKKPETLARQIAMFDQLVESTFKRV